MEATGSSPGSHRVRPDTDNDRILLEGPHSRTKELRLVLQVAREFIVGFRTLHFVGPCVTVFGSARFPESHPHYSVGREIGRALAQLGFTVMTGGGPGLMEAANRGAREAGGTSVGCNIELPAEQHPNPFLDNWITRRIMRRIARAAGGDTDVSRDYEYTDWEQVGSFARAFSNRVNESRRQTPAA